MFPRNAIPALVLLASLLGASAAQAISLRYRLSDLLRVAAADPGTVFSVADLNGDGTDDLVESVPGRALCVLVSGRSLTAYRDVTLDPEGVAGRAGDATGDGRADLLEVAMHGGRAWVSCLDLRDPKRADRPLWTVGPFLDSCAVMPKMHARGHVRVLAVLDANADGLPEVYLDVQPYVPGGEPRRIVCLDGPTGRELWRCIVAAGTSSLQLLSRRYGFERHLILESYAPDNGFAAGSESDAHAYLTSLTPEGRREWSIETGGIFSTVFSEIGDLDGDGQDDLVVSTTVAAEAEADSAAVARLFVVDPATGRSLRGVSIPSGFRPCLGDLDGDGRAEIVGAGQDQALYCYGNDFRLRWVNRQRPLRDIIKLADLDGDGALEILASQRDALGVLDGRGQLLFWQDFSGSPVTVRPMRIGSATRVLIATRDQLRLVTCARADVSPGALAVIGSVLAAGAGGLGYATRRRRRGEWLVERGEAQDRLLDAMTAFGHAGSSLAVVHRLQLHLRNWERVRDNAEARAALAGALEDFENGVLPALVRLVSLARRAQVRGQHWRPLAARGLAVSAELHQLLDGGGGGGAHLQRAADALEQLDACTAGLRAHLRHVFRAPLGPVLRRVQARRAQELVAAGIELSVTFEGTEDLHVFAAPGQLDDILDHLVENAARAMRESPARRLAIVARTQGGSCRIDVSDTGCGILGDDHERIFDRDYSTREGGGFGLYFARQTLARYEGRIFLERSAPGQGSTLRLVLRAV